MAINNPTTSRTTGLLEQVLAERQQLAGAGSPSSQPSAPLRELVQGPQLQSESPGSNRVASVKPNLQLEAQAVIPPQTAVPGAEGSVPMAPVPGQNMAAPQPGGVVGPRIGMDEVPLPPGPAAPGGPQWQNPNPPANAAPAAQPAVAPAAPGRPIGPAPIRSFTAPQPSRIGNRLIVDLGTKVRDSGYA